MSTPVRPRRSAVALILATAAWAGGCGGDDGPNDRAAGLTADELVKQSLAASDAVTAFRLGADISFTAKVAPGTLPKLLEDALAGPVTIVGEGPVNDDDVSFDFDATVQGLPPLQANVTKVGGELFAGVLGTDYRVALPRTDVAAIVPARLPSTLLSWVAAPRVVGREDSDGGATVHVSATVDPQRALDDFMPILTSATGTKLSASDRTRFTEALTTRTIDVWIGADDLIPRKVIVDLDYRGGVRRLAAVRRAALTFTLSLTKIGQPVTIATPRTTNVLDLARLRSLAGS